MNVETGGSFAKYINDYKTGVINYPLGQTHSLASSEHCFRFVLLDLKSGDGRAAGQQVRKQWSLQAVTVG